MRRIFFTMWTVSLAVVGFVIATPSFAEAGTLTGCSGTATSIGSDGSVIDNASAASGRVTSGQSGIEGFSKERPFEVQAQGKVNYEGQSDTAITNHRWEIRVSGIKVASGGSDNADKTTKAAGTADVKSYNPLGITGLLAADGFVAGDGGRCDGSGWIKIAGNPLTSPVTWVASVLALLGILALFLSLPGLVAAAGPATAQRVERHRIRGVFGGLLLGLGVAMLLISFAVIALGTLTPLVGIVAFAILGLVLSWFGPARGAAAIAPG